MKMQLLVIYHYDAIGNIVSQNNQQNALPNGLGGVSLQTYEYDAMNRLIHSSGGNSDAGVSYHFSQTYSPSGRIGDKFCDFTHSDHLGSSSWTTDANGHAIQHIEYLPFGEEFVNQHITSYRDRYTFTGKELDAESNLYYYEARYNSSTYSQFTSPDPMSDKLPNFNPYLYCYGNPIKFIDPDGRYGYTDNEGSYIWFDNIQTKGTFTDNKGKEWTYVTSNKHDWDVATTIRNAVILFLFITTTNEFHQIEKDVALFDEKSCLFTKEVKLMNANRYINDWIKAFSTNSEGDSFTSNNKVGSYTLKFYEYKGDKKRGERNVVGIVKADFLDHVKEASKELLERIIFQEKADNDPMFDMHYDNANGLLEFLTQPAQLKQSK